MKLCLLTTLLMMAGPLWAADRYDIEKEKKEAVARLLARKTAFEEHWKEQQRRQQQRLAEADKMPQVRQKFAEAKEKARRSFRRQEQVFPKDSYQAFINKREQRRIVIEKARQQYSRMQNQLEEIYQNKQYNIDGNKEYNL